MKKINTKSLFRPFCQLLILIFIFTQSVPVFAQDTTAAPLEGNITIANNAGIADTIYITGLYGGEKINVYNAASGGKLLATTKASTSKSEATIKINQLGTAAGSVYITLTGVGELESGRTKVSYDAEVQSAAPSADYIYVTNNSGSADIVNVSGLYGGETIKVYNQMKSGKLLGSGKVPATSTELSIKINQLGIEAGSVFVTVTNAGELESDRTEVAYLAEPQSDAPSSGSITVTNNAGIADVIRVNYLSTGDTVKIYDAPKGGTLLASATTPSSKTEVTISITQLDTYSGSIYVSLTRKGKRESERTQVIYDGEKKSAAASDSNITVTNNASSSDTVKVTGLLPSAVVRVYDAETGGNQLGTATVSSSGTEATVTISQLGVSAGFVYVTITNKGSFESERIKVSYAAEASSTPALPGNIIVTNNSGKSDTVYISGLTPSDVVKVYSSYTGATALGSATVPSSGTEATVTISQLGTSSGVIYVSVTSKGKLESARIAVGYPSEPVSDAVANYNITVVNNPAGTADTITVSGLTAGDVVKVYDASVSGTLLGTTTVSSSKTEAAVSVTQLGTAAGSVYVSVTSKNKTESGRVQATYSAESQTASPDPDDIAVTNNVAGTADTVEVTGLTEGSVIKVYSASLGGKLLGSATVSSGKTYATVSIAQLGSTAGSVYITITEPSRLESARIEAAYTDEASSTSIGSSNISITNNSGSADTVEVTGLTEGDIVKVYNAAKGGTLLGSATVGSYGTYATVTISQLGTSAGTVYVSITSTNKTESSRTAAAYSAEAQSVGSTVDNVIVTNNSGSSDTVQVIGLTTGDIVTVYDSSVGGSKLGTATVSSGTSATVSISQLGTSAGNVYVTVTSAKKLESARTAVAYAAEVQSDAPSANEIEIDNNVNSSDLVKVTGLLENDAVTVYSAANGGTVLGTATVATYVSSVSISITQLGTSAGSVYVTVTSKNKLESVRTEAAYAAEAQSDAISADKVTIANNAGISDTINITGLKGGDVVNVYNAAKVGTLLGTATVSVYSSSAVINVTQLGTSAGSVYISVTSAKKLESPRTQVDYLAEAQSAAPAEADITIVNNAGIADTIKVTGLIGGNVINAYDRAVGGTLLGTATAGTYDAYATISVDQLGSAAGTVYVTVTRSGYLESSRTAAVYSVEPTSSAASASYISVVNNAGNSDTVTVSGLTGGDAAYVYDSPTGGMLLGSAAVSTYDSKAVITITQLGADAGNIYVSVKRTGKLESARTTVPYMAEQQSNPPAESNITINNYSGISDTIEVTYLNGYDVVNVYNAETDGTLLGTATVGADATEVTVTITQLGSAAGTVYISVTSTNKLESARTAVAYTKETTTAAPDIANIAISNYSSLDDTIYVSYVKPRSVVYVYSKSSGGTLLGSATVDENSDEVTFKLSGLDSAGGTVYVCVKGYGEAVSDRTAVAYPAEAQTTAPSSTNIAVANNCSGTYDTITVLYLGENDTVKVYTAATGGTLLGTATVSSGTNYAIVYVSQLGASAGNVYVSVTGYGKKASDRTQVYYTAEATSDAPLAANVTIVNNPSGTKDTITVTGLSEYDVVKIYSSSSGGTLLGSGEVDEDETEVTIKISQLGTSSGNVYITVTSPGEYESGRTKVSYDAE